MTFEVVASEIGVVTTTDVKDVPAGEKCVVIVVLAQSAPPVVREVAFGEISGGHAAHRGLRCPTCGTARYKLFHAGDELGCGPCARRRSRRQRERSCRSWNKYDGALEDRVLRALRPGRPSNFVHPSTLSAVERLMRADQARLEGLLECAAAAHQMGTTATVDIAVILEEIEA